jgi:high-affinity iron transporter
VIPALIIVLREVFEAGLIVGIVLAATRTIPGRGYWVSGGVAVGVAGSCIVAVFAGALSAAFEGAGQELFNACVLFVAVAMLTWHNVWMTRHGKELAKSLAAAGRAVVDGKKSLAALAVVVAVAVLREGFEVVMFLYGVLATDGTSGISVLIGGAAGLAIGALICFGTYFGLVHIPDRYLFGVTSIMIAFLAAGMAAQAIAFLEQANILTALGNTVWDTSWLLTDDSFLGRAMHTLIGYTERPSGMQLVAYLLVLAVMFTLMRLLAPPPRQTHAAMPAE